MFANVKNFRGIGDATIKIEPIALLCGSNGAGKTSMARAIGAAVTGRPIPFDKVTKKDCGILLKNGTKAAEVAVGNNENYSKIDWAAGKAEISSLGTPPQASEIAAGLTDLFSMDSKKALSYMINLLRADPTKADLDGEFEKNNLEPKVADAVWKIISEKGWDSAHEQAKQTGQQLKGGWQQVTGQAYGDKKAQEYYPEGWDDTLFPEGTTLDSISAEIAAKQKLLEDAIKKEAVGSFEYTRLKQAVDSIPAVTAEIATFKKKVEDTRIELKKIEDDLKTIPNPNAKEQYACPHCDGMVNISAVSGSDYLLTKASDIKAPKKEDRVKYAKLCGTQQNLSAAITGYENSAAKLQIQLDELNKAAELFNKTEKPAESDTSVSDEIRRQITVLNSEFSILKKYNEAHWLAKQISGNQSIINALDEKGLRKIKLGECLDAFTSSYIEELCTRFGVPIVSLDSDLNVELGTVPYQMLSASEQFRVRTILQIAIAQLEKASIVIIDGADILDGKGRTSLLNVIVNADIPSTLICMTLAKNGVIPDLKKSGYGATYWVENGSCKEYAAPEQKAA